MRLPSNTDSLSFFGLTQNGEIYKGVLWTTSQSSPIYHNWIPDVQPKRVYFVKVSLDAPVFDPSAFHLEMYIDSFPVSLPILRLTSLIVFLGLLFLHQVHFSFCSPAKKLHSFTPLVMNFQGFPNLSMEIPTAQFYRFPDRLFFDLFSGKEFTEKRSKKNRKNQAKIIFRLIH